MLEDSTQDVPERQVFVRLMPEKCGEYPHYQQVRLGICENPSMLQYILDDGNGS